MADRIFVHVGIAEWHDVFWHRVDALVSRTGQACCTVAVQENQTVPRNIVFLEMDPNVWGQVLVWCHPLDREAADMRVMEIGGKLVAVNPLRAVSDD